MNILKNFIKTALKAALPKPAFAKLKGWAIPDGYIHFSGGWASKVKFNEDGLATAHNADFLNSDRFIAAYEAGCATNSWGPRGESHIRWRVFNACTLAKYALRVPGEFVECGTNRGGTAAAIISYTRFESAGKTFFLLDTFSGYDPSTLTEKERKLVSAGMGASYLECYSQVKARFGPYPFVKIIKGTVPSTLDEVRADKIAFLHLDMNCSAPERAAIEYLWDRITPGGVVLLDDYGWDDHEEQKETLDEFAASKHVEVVGMATGQGMILKPYW